MTASLCGAATVAATDGDENSLRHLEEVLDANAAALPRRPDVPPPLRWEAATASSAKALGAPFDVVLGADVTYRPRRPRLITARGDAAAATRIVF